MKIGIASDHHGIDKRKELISFLKNKGYEVVDYGPDIVENIDYPEYAFKVARDISNNKLSYGILMCGTGIGMSIAANKVKGVRCARICSVDDARLSKEHNNANIVAFSANLDIELQKQMIITFLTTLVSKEERHIRRVNMINNYHD